MRARNSCCVGARARDKTAAVMRNTLLIVTAASTLLAPSVTRADNQTPADKPDAEVKAPPVLEPALPPRFYGNVEFLYWWSKPAPLSVPLVSSGPVTATHHGLLGVPALDAEESSILYGAPHSPAKSDPNIAVRIP